MQTKRIIGYDLARALAIFGMVIVNYNMEERCSQICTNIKEKVEHPVDFFVVDNMGIEKKKKKIEFKKY